MKTHFGYAVLALALSCGAASAQTTIITREPATETVITGQPTLNIRERAVLTPDQRTIVYRTIVRERPLVPVPAPVIGPAAVELRVGDRIPVSTQLYAIPESAAIEVPTVRPYKYMVVNNRVVLVDPATSTVVSEIVE